MATRPPIISSLLRLRPSRPFAPPRPRNGLVRHDHNHRRLSSSNPPRPPLPPPQQPSTRLDRLLNRLPTSLRTPVARLRSAPLSHAVAFLILHEITAIAPLLGLFALFHYYSELPLNWAVERYGALLGQGATRAERYFRRKGWFGLNREEDGEQVVEEGREDGEEDVLKRWRGDARYKVVLEVAVAWAITKTLLPVRIAVSLWATPWFARVLGQVQRLVRLRR